MNYQIRKPGSGITSFPRAAHRRPHREETRRPPTKANERAPHPDFLHQIFERQADARPGAVAVLADLEKTTYSMLEFNANRLARHLRSRGVKRGSRVAVLLPCSTDAYAAILAILKAGAAYVPLDVEYPRDRISYILNESGAEVLLTTSDRTRQFSGFRGTVIHLDSDRIEIDAESSLRLAPAEVGASPRDLCYIMYKSGSMGPPNGVMVQHRQASHLVYAEGETFHFRPEDCVHQGASLSFDNSIEEMWLAFESGALLISPNLQVAHTGPDLSR